MNTTQKLIGLFIINVILIVSMMIVLFVTNPVQIVNYHNHPEKTAIIQTGERYYIVDLVSIRGEWYVERNNSSLQGKLEDVYPGAVIIQEKDPETNLFEPIK